HVLVEVEAVDGMDGERHAREPRRDPPDGAGDRVVRVYDGVVVRAQMAHQAAEEAAQAGGRETTRDVERGDGRVAQIEAREVRAGAADDVSAELGVPTEPGGPVGVEGESGGIGG